MDNEATEFLQVMREGITKNKEAQSIDSKSDVKGVKSSFFSSRGNDTSASTGDRKDKGFISKNEAVDKDAAGKVNVEASIRHDDVIRAGGFGARDDISSFLPVASDSTDFEATILDARNYEEPQAGMSRPGLGWRKATERK